MNEPRTLKRLLLGLIALLLAWQAQIKLTGPIRSDGVILYALAVVLFVLVFARTEAAQVARGKLTALPAALSNISRWRALLIGLALLSSLIGFALFASPASQPTAWLYHILSVLLFASAFIFDQPFRRTFRIRPVALYGGSRFTLPVSRPHLAALFTILALAVFARLWQIDEFPEGTWFDEAFTGETAVQMLNESDYRPIFLESALLPAHFTYLVALSFKLFGVSTTSMRFVTAAFGIGTVVLAYLLFRRWLGEREGLVAAALFAVLRYDLTLSRLAMHPVATPFFELLTLYFLDRALERKRLSDVAWTALALGFGLAFYFAFRLFVVVPFAFLLGLGVLCFLRRRAPLPAAEKQSADRKTNWRFIAAVLFVFLIGVFIALTPILQFAIQKPDAFFSRTNTVSIFERRDEPDLAKALWNNFTKHMLMFNLQGDRNGRHNLPNEPMLDPLMGALAVLGFAYALWRWRDPPNLLMLLLFFVMNLGGILTLDFEAPQSLRSVGVMPALVYFAVLPLAMVGREVERLFRAAPISAIVGAGSPRPSAGSRPYAIALVVLIAAITYANFDTFFNRQKNASDAWAAYSTPETIVAREMNHLAPAYDLVVTSLIARHPTVRFIASKVSEYDQWTANDRLPLVRDAARGVALLLDPLSKSAYDAARQYYPNATYREFRPPRGGATVIYEVVLTPADLRSVQGLVARYYKGETFDGTPVREEAVSSLKFDWTQAQPVSGAFSAELRGTLHAPVYGKYRFAVNGAPNASIWIDEMPVSDAAVTLAKGNHALRVRLGGNAGKVEVQWQLPNSNQLQAVPASALFRPPVTNSGLLGAYYRNADWSGAPEFMQVDTEINLYFHNLPLPRPYSVEWKGKIFAPNAGLYRLATDSLDDSQVFVNGALVVANRGGTVTEGAAQMAQGWNDIVIRYADKTSHTHIYLYWTPPGGVREIVPSRYLSPPMGVYPTAAEIMALPKPLPLPTPPTSQPSPFPPATSAAPLSLAPVRIIGSAGSGSAQFKDPRALAIGAGGRLFVADTGNRRVQVLESDGKFVRAIEGGEAKFVEPFDLVIDPAGTLIVLDSEEGWLYRFDQDGDSLGRVAGPTARLFRPRGLSVDASGNLYIADTGGSRVVKISPDGQVLRAFGVKGSGKGQFVEPSDAAVDESGYLFATDVPNRRIQVFSDAGQYLLDFAIPLANPFNGPHIAFAPDGSLLVTAPEPHKVQRYARDGTLLGEWGGAGTELGKLRLPTGITVVGNTVWVADTGNHRIQQWELK